MNIQITICYILSILKLLLPILKLLSIFLLAISFVISNIVTSECFVDQLLKDYPTGRKRALSFSYIILPSIINLLIGCFITYLIYN